MRSGPGRTLASIAALACLARFVLPGAAPAVAPEAAIANELQARSDYIENCAGCHGIRGNSAPALVPELLNRVGYFMCQPYARAYLLRLPNIAHSRITDNEELADLMNYVVFRIGGPSTPSDALPFTGGEVARERQLVLAGAALKKVRADMVDRLIRACKAPASLKLLYPGQVVAHD